MGGEELTFQLGVGVAGGSSRGGPEEADDAEEDEVQDVPEVIGDPVKLPLLIVLVGDLEVHLVCNPADADPDHDGQRVGEPAVQLQLGACLPCLHPPHTQPVKATEHPHPDTRGR